MGLVLHCIMSQCPLLKEHFMVLSLEGRIEILLAAHGDFSLHFCATERWSWNTATGYYCNRTEGREKATDNSSFIWVTLRICKTIAMAGV